jgi:DnaJ-class molecular chaperone
MSSFKPRIDKTKHYMTLSVPFDADLAVIKSSYKRLAIRYHPDKHMSSSERERELAARQFQGLAAAYEVLSDPEKRAAYDAHGMPGVQLVEEGGSERFKEDDASFDHYFRRNGRNTSDASSSNSRAEASSGGGVFDDSEQRAAWARAFQTYRDVFGHNPVADVKANSPHQGAPSPPTVVHNMAAQRGGGTFDEVQKQRLDEMLAGVDLKKEEGSGQAAAVAQGSDQGATPNEQPSKAQNETPRPQQGSALWKPPLSTKSGGRYSGQAWSH